MVYDSRAHKNLQIVLKCSLTKYNKTIWLSYEYFFSFRFNGNNYSTIEALYVKFRMDMSIPAHHTEIKNCV
jgi:hypothetical protein